MKKTIYYWSPCLNKVGTVISTKNSAISIAKYKKNQFSAKLINACGEWDEYKTDLVKYGVDVIDLNIKYFRYLPKTGYIPSRLSYFIIFIFSFFPLLFLLKKEKPDFIIIHLITSLPLFLLKLFSFNTKFILRISGYPKLNIIRKVFWKNVANKLYKITCPTEELFSKLTVSKIFPDKKICFLQDAIINLDNFQSSQMIDYKNYGIKNKKVILAVGRLTAQKNFSYLISEFSNFLKKNDFPIQKLFGLSEFETNKNDAILIGSDKELKTYAKKNCGYKLDKGLDVIIRISKKYYLGEAKWITDSGGNQNKSFLDALNSLVNGVDTAKADIIMILDGACYLKSEQKTYKDITTKYKEKNIMSALFLKEFIEEKFSET